MATREELIGALRRADAAGATKDAQRIAKMIRNMDEQSGGDGGFAGQFNKVLVDAVGGAAEMTNAGLRKLGAPEWLAPAGARDTAESAAEFMGINIPDGGPSSAPGAVGQVAGEAAMMFAPMFKGAQAMSKAGGTTGRVGQMIYQDMVSPSMGRQARNTASAIGGTTGAGIARYATQDQEGAIPVYAEMGGALLGSSMTGAGALRGAWNTGNWAWRHATDAWTEPGAIRRAAKLVQDFVTDPQMAAASIEDLKGTNLRPAAASGDEGLMILERAILDDKEFIAKSREFADKTSASIQELTSQIKRSGSTLTTREFLDAKMARLNAALEARTESAAERAVSAVRELDPNGTTADFSAVVKSELDTALADAKVQEGMLWEAVPREAPTPLKSTMAAYRAQLDTLTMAQADDMPAVATKVLTKLDEIAESYGGKVQLQDLDGLYKKLGEVSRQARANGEFNRARIADSLRNGILEDMGEAGGDQSVRDSIKLARAFSKKLNETFNSGSVGRILGRAKDGGLRIDETLALDKTVGRGGQTGRLSADAIGRSNLRMEGQDIVQGENLGALDSIQQYLKAGFMRNVVEEGRVNPQKAANFMRRNKEVLDGFPHLREQLDAARSAEDVARRVAKRNEAFKRKFDRPAVSAAARFLNAPVDREIQTILGTGTKNPGAVMRKIIDSARSSGDSEAVEGIQAGLSNWLIDLGTKGSQVDAEGFPVINAIRMRMALEDPRTGEAFAAAFGDDTAQIYDSVEQLVLWQRQQLARNTYGEITTGAPWLIQKLARMVGARAGARLAGTTGGSIQMAQMGASEGERFINRYLGDPVKQVLADALENPELMQRLLMSDAKNPRLGTKVNLRTVAEGTFKDKVINSYFLSRGARLLQDEEEEPQ